MFNQIKNFRANPANTFANLFVMLAKIGLVPNHFVMKNSISEPTNRIESTKYVLPRPHIARNVGKRGAEHSRPELVCAFVTSIEKTCPKPKC